MWSGCPPLLGAPKMLSADALTLEEFAMHEQLPLAVAHAAALEFLQGRNDIVVFGAQAVNAYVSEPRMTQETDVMAADADAVATEIRDYLQARFHIAVRTRSAGGGRGFRVFQSRESGNRYLVDVHGVATLPASETIEQVSVMAPPDLIAAKVTAYTRRRGQPKSGTDWRDIAMLFLRFPELKERDGVVAERLVSAKAQPDVIETWTQFADNAIVAADDDEYF